MSAPEIFREPIPKATTRRLAEEGFLDMVKFVVDTDRRLLCAGGELHSDEEALLLQDGSAPENLWGGNYYLDDPSEERFEYTSMINIRPDHNPQQLIRAEKTRKKVREIAAFFFESHP